MLIDLNTIVDQPCGKPYGTVVDRTVLGSRPNTILYQEELLYDHVSTIDVPLLLDGVVRFTQVPIAQWRLVGFL